MKVQILKHKTQTGCSGAIKGGILFKTWANVPPQLFPEYADMAYIMGSFFSVDKKAGTIDDFFFCFHDYLFLVIFSNSAFASGKQVSP